MNVRYVGHMEENQWSQYLNDKEFADILPTKHEFTASWNSNPMCFPLSIRSFIQIQKWNQQNRISLLAFTKKENGSSNNKP